MCHHNLIRQINYQIDRKCLLLSIEIHPQSESQHSIACAPNERNWVLRLTDLHTIGRGDEWSVLLLSGGSGGNI